MTLHLENPTQLRLQGFEPRRAELVNLLAYTDKKAEWALRKFENSRAWHTAQMGELAYKQRLAELRAATLCSLLFEDERGLWTYSGMKELLIETFGDPVTVGFQRPAPKLVPWAVPPEHEPRYYQVAAEKALLEVGHAAVEIGTGLGKSFIILRLLKALGLKAIVMAPTSNIAEQLYDEISLRFGPSKVGFFGAGKKQFDKLFTVAIAASLTKVEPGSPAHKALSQAHVFIADESHMCPAATLQKICFGLAARASYRFFFSGTQMRSDGLDSVLDAITGPIVYRMTVQEGVDQGFLAKPLFRMCWVDSNVRDRDGNLFECGDANKMTRAHVLYNPDLQRKIAEIANKSVALMGRPTVILVDELEQLSYLIPHLRFEFRFAHGGVTKENRDKIPPEYHDSDPKQLVKEFNAGLFPILIGTSCIAMGTDIKAVKALLWDRAGKSEVELRQGVGRCTRLVPGKEDCIFIDFGIRNVEMMERHSKARRTIVRAIYPSYSEIQM